jgi:lipid-A-disaccharide synthase
VRKIARRVDRLAVVFPFEPPLYETRLPGVEFVGHPLLDRVRVTRSREETRARYGLDASRRTVVLLPGSRTTEIENLLPPLLDAARRLAREDDCQFALALAHTLTREEVEARLAAPASRCRSWRATRTTSSPRATWRSSRPGRRRSSARSSSVPW